ncbi:MAG: ribosome small subunit-dependent GTPase A [Bacteroidetes bacterium]|nr:MAG: ribosome small subunit-dependent GTPase A [Bacteroidota bacterium]
MEGLIIKSTGSHYLVKDKNNNKFECKIKGKFRIKGIRSTNPVAVGDVVDFIMPENEQLGFITHIHDRKNYIIRKSINLSKRSHIIATNVDAAFLIVTLVSPTTTTEFIDRYLVSAQAYNIPVNIVFNKIDLYDNETLEKLKELKSIYEKIGYRCIETSAKKNVNINIIRELLKDRISVISGHSGVGKSTLINAVDKKLNIKTSEISDFHNSGKHTTTLSEMYELSSGGYIIDTPGIKGFGIIDMDKEEIYHFFPEIFKLSGNCQFYNCTHIHEPNCAVKKAVETGMISLSRYNSYLSIMLEDENNKYRQTDY